MRPEKLQRELYKAIQLWNNGQDSSVFKRLLEPMKRQWAKWAKEEGDYRGGYITYGYSDRESVENNMMYISDRWMCAFRLKWLIDGIENGRI